MCTEPDGGAQHNEHVVWLGPPLVDLESTGTIRGWSSGYVLLDDGEVLEGVDVVRHLAARAGAIDDAVARCNGCFAVVLVTPDGAYLATDRGGTTPIYTTASGGRLF